MFVMYGTFGMEMCRAEFNTLVAITRPAWPRYAIYDYINMFSLGDRRHDENVFFENQSGFVQIEFLIV